MAGITALNKNGRYAFGGGGSYVSGPGKDKYQGGSGAPGSAESKAMGGAGSSYSSPSDHGGTGNDPGGYVSKTNPTGTLTGDDYRTAKKEFEYNVDKRKLKRPKDEYHLKNKTIPDATSLYYTGVPKSNIPYFGNFLNMTRPLRNKGLRKNIDYFLALKSRNPNLEYEDTLEGYKQYMSDRLSGSITASGNTIYNTGGNDNTSIPLYAGNTIEENIGGNLEDETKEFDYRFGTGQNVGADVTQGFYAASGGRVPRNMGGIMGVVPRQGYFLGKIVKGVGKAVGSVADAAGKVLKSDVGKMALLAGGAYLAGGYLPGGGGIRGGFSNFSNLAKNALLKDRALGFTKDNLSLMKILGLSAALPFVPGINKAPENEDIGMGTRGGRLIDPLTGDEATPAEMRANIENAKIEAGGDPIKLAALNQKYNNMLFTTKPYENYGIYAAANGGRIGKAEGGLMDLGGMEKDYRAEGGFVPIGKAEKADDVPARLSVNEFVFTADAVRNAGGGDIDKGAKVMENMMKNLENGGRVSEESQGNTGAQQMFSVSERIGEVI